MDNKIFLERMRAKQSSDTSPGLNVELKGNRKLIPFNDVSNVISQMEQYTEERGKCNKIRLTCQVNPICSNILFNRISEIVKYEGSSGVTFLNYGIGGNKPFEDGQVIYKPETMEFWSGGTMAYQSVDPHTSGHGPNAHIREVMNNDISPNMTIQATANHPTNAIRDMQLSRNDEKGDHFVYHCGLDILNNHLIRSNTFKCISKMPDNFNEDYTAFNTIADYMRDAKGNKVIEKAYFPVSSGVDGGAKFLCLHTYLYDDILTFNDAISQRLIEKHNGWLGFSNKSKIKSYSDFKAGEDMRMERPVMYMNGGDFIDMYPGRDLYSFVPKYNEYRNRMEKNWNYCITYPSSSTTEGFDDIIETYNNSMKTIYFDENTRGDNGSMQLVMYSKAKHGLSSGDRVNIYKTYEDISGNTIQEKIIDNAEVDEVVNDFIFTTFTQGQQISNDWVQLTDGDKISGFTVSGDSGEETYTVPAGVNGFFIDDDFERYFIINGKYVNIDKTAQNITYKKVVGGIECDYYVRIFSRLPNFRFTSGDTESEFTIYNKEHDGKNLLEMYQHPKYDFESHVSRLAFARNVYSDEIGEIVFTDDIDLSNIHDNLGRPLSEIYLTIVKNNAGYKEWYGFDDVPVEISADTVEFSHCFGKITCGLDMSLESKVDTYTNNIRVINNLLLDGLNLGYDVSLINDRDADSHITPEEVDFNNDINYYGDLCYYDNYNAMERVIQPVMHRFNTAQRESSVASSGNYFSTLVYDEIYRDDYDTGDEFLIKQYTQTDCNKRPEGYYYNPHYKIQIKSLGKLNSIMPQFLSIQSIVNNGDIITVTTQQYHFLTPGDKAMIYDDSVEKYYYLTTIRGTNDNSRTFTCKVTTEKGEPATGIDDAYIGDYKLFKIDNLGAPSYAHLLKDGTCRYIWRNVINNGSPGGDESLEEYPFTNGAFYVNKRVDLYLRRQDPYDEYDLYDEDDIEKLGISIDIDQINQYYNEDEIKC